ncbi:hypothetical protein ACOMHN_017286 [Nucella lapillus]
MTPGQGRPLSEDKNGVDLEPILAELGHCGRYQLIQLALTIYASMLIASPTMNYVFTGYQPDHQCSQVDNVTQLEDYLPADVTGNFTLHDVTYQQCSIDVTVNSSGSSSTHSLPCVAGVNFSMPSDTSFLTEWSLVCDKAGLSQLTQTGMFCGQIAGSFVASVLADRYGRKKVYIVCAFCLALTNIAMAWVPVYYLFVVGKVAEGFFLTGMVNPAYTMFMELLPQHWRYMASVMDAVMWALGCLYLSLLAYLMQGLSWRYLSMALTSLYAFTLLLPWFLDESLRWLLATGEIAEAEKILKKACRANGKDFKKIQVMLHKQLLPTTTNYLNMFEHIQACSTSAHDRDEDRNKTELARSATNKEEMDEEKLLESTALGKIAQDVCIQRREGGTHSDRTNTNSGYSAEDSLKQEGVVFSAKYTVLDLFRYRVVFVPFLVTSFVWISNSLYYFATMIGSAKFSGNRFLNFSLLSLQSIPSTIVALCLVRRFNRRPLAFTYGLLAGTFLLISVGLIASGGGGVTLTVATVAHFIGMFCLSGSYILLFVQYMEVYPTALRVVGAGSTTILSRTIVMAAPFFQLWAEKNPWAPGLFLGLLRCLTSFFIWLLPETRHRKLPDTMEEIQAWKRKEPVVL